MVGLPALIELFTKRTEPSSMQMLTPAGWKLLGVMSPTFRPIPQLGPLGGSM